MIMEWLGQLLCNDNAVAGPNWAMDEIVSVVKTIFGFPFSFLYWRSVLQLEYNKSNGAMVPNFGGWVLDYHI